MSRFPFYILMLVLPAGLTAQMAGRCGTDAQREALYAADTNLIQKRIELEKWTQQWIEENKNRVMQRSLITIPVVVHVIWHQTVENISTEQILSQIEVLNQDFNALNVEVAGIPSIFRNLVANVEFEFCLANLDPHGNPTTGITRTYTDNSIGIGGTEAIHYTNLGGHSAWDTKKYLNIWVAKFAGSVGGTASFPGEGVPEEDGLEIDYRQFGKIGLAPPYHLGRTATHEMGHYFNLEHVWGRGINSCCGNDFVEDTPPACETYLQKCPVVPAITCSSPDMYMNYMFYTNDACMGMFTVGQKMRMLAAVNGPRSGLLSSIGCQAVPVSEPGVTEEITLLNNPANDHFSFILNGQTPDFWQVALFDLWGKIHYTGLVRTNDAHEISVQQMASGIYFLRLENNGKVMTKKIVVRN